MQRTPPTEKRGRVHTSTVTVAVLSGAVKGSPDKRVIPESDLRIEWFSGSGAGGQHRNKHQNACRLIHIPTGIRKESQSRSRRNSYQRALDALSIELSQQAATESAHQHNLIRSEQVGTGYRGDKIRTYRFQEDRVVCHRTGRSFSCKKFMAGKVDL